VQPSSEGLAQAYIIGADFIKGDRSVLILGDNIYHGHGLPELLGPGNIRPSGATVFAYHVNDPQRYGIVEFDERGRAISVEEKPRAPRSNWADFAATIFAILARKGMRTPVVTPISSADYPTAARRPTNSRLDCSKLARVHRIELPSWRSSLRSCLERLSSEVDQPFRS